MFGIDDLGFALGGLAAAGGSVASAAMQNSANSELSEGMRAWSSNMDWRTKEYNSIEAQKARDFQAQMSNSAYQRSVADMRAAGLNPALMFGSGGAASTPSGSQASSGGGGMPSTPHMERLPVGDLISKAVTSAFESRQLSQAQARTDSEVGANAALKSLRETQAQESAHAARQAKVDADIAEYSKSAKQTEIDADKAFNEFRKKYPEVEYLMGKVGQATSAFGSLMGGAAAGKYLFKQSPTRLRSNEVILNTDTGSFR